MKRFEFISCFIGISFSVFSCGEADPESFTNGGSAPTAKILVNRTAAVVGETIQFSDASSDADNDIVKWSWDFADGSSPSSAKKVDYAYPAAGSYLVTLTVTDRLNNTATSTVRVLVKNAFPPDFGSLGSGIRERIPLMHPLTMVCAHRAMHEAAPENSLPAIQAAIDNNINVVEIDARLTLDKQVVIMHDAATARTTTGNLTVAQATLSDLKKLRLLFNGVATVHEIPSLRECLTTAKGKVYVNIDASWDNSMTYYNKLYNEVAALNMVNMVFFYTENAAVAKGLMDLDSDVTVLLGAGNNTDWTNANIMNPKARLWHLATATLNAAYTTLPFSEGIRFFANAYVNSATSPPAAGVDNVVELLLNNRVSIIQTDFPRQVKMYLQAKTKWMP